MVWKESEPLYLGEGEWDSGLGGKPLSVLPDGETKSWPPGAERCSLRSASLLFLPRGGCTIIVTQAPFSAWDGGRVCPGKCRDPCPQDTDDLHIGPDHASVGSPWPSDQELKTAVPCPSLFSFMASYIVGAQKEMKRPSLP